MTATQIQARMTTETLKHQTALKMLEILTAAKKESGLKGDELEEFEGAIWELLTED